MPYTGQFTFVRVNYTTAPGGYWYQGLPAWAHGFPLADKAVFLLMLIAGFNFFIGMFNFLPLLPLDGYT